MAILRIENTCSENKTGGLGAIFTMDEELADWIEAQEYENMPRAVELAVKEKYPAYTMPKEFSFSIERTSRRRSRGRM